MKKLMILLISVLLILALVSIVSADELSFRTIDAYVDGNIFTNIEKDTSDLEIRPGEELRLVIEIENLFDEREDIEIDGIELTVTIHDIRGNGDDLYYEFRHFGLDAGEDKDKEVVFDIPGDVLTGDYILDIEAEGRDDNKKTQQESFVFPLHLRKRAHDVLISQPFFDPARVDCGEMTILSIELDNRGQVAENVKVTVTNVRLGIEHKYETTLKVGSMSQGSKAQKDFQIFVPEDAKEGTYEFDVAVEYFDRTIVKNVILTVTCDTPAGSETTSVVEKTGVNVVGKSVVETPAEKSSIISSIFKSRTNEIALFSGLGIIILVLIFVITGMLIKRG